MNFVKCTKLLLALQFAVERMMEEGGNVCVMSVLGKSWKKGSKNTRDHFCMSDMNTPVNSNQGCNLCCVPSNQPVWLHPLSFRQNESSVIQKQ